MSLAVVSAVYNEQKHIARLMDSLLGQTREPDEIVFVDDGSTDQTAQVIEDYSKKYPLIRLIRNTNQGPAASRNLAWKNAVSDLIVLTDGDCVPNRDWLENLEKRFQSDEVAAVGGAYRTLNDDKILARFVGWEFSWRYRNVQGEIDAHGAYNLAIRRRVLEEMNGFNEHYKAPSGEDWDLTYRISRKYKMLFAPDAVVAHAHPESFGWYMKNQVRRGFDRIKLYNDHPEKRSGDVYTSRVVKYQVLAAGLSPLTLLFSGISGFRWISLGLLMFLLFSCFYSFPYIFKRDPAAAVYGILVQFCRCFAWAVGAVKGVLRYGVHLGSN